jgi:pimeloyl-ACP methyl ester carboxylesterase
MTLLLGAPMAAAGYEVVAVDNLGYGLTQVAPRSTPSYDDWVDLMVDFVQAERERDDRPIVLFGLSAGGMLAYHVAAQVPPGTLQGIVGMAFLDQRDPQVRRETAHDAFTARVGIPAVHLLARTPLGRIRYPMTLASKMRYLCNNPNALRAFYQDRTSAGNWVSLKFLSSYLNYKPLVEPEDFDACPVLLTQPGQDRWSPLALSAPLLSRITKVPVTMVELTNAGHFPLEDPGVFELHRAVERFMSELTHLSRS